MTRFTKKVVVVTGSARGIGLVTARRFAAEGADLAFVDRDGAAAAVEAARACDDFGIRARAWEVNIADIEQVQRSHAEIVEALGVPEVLVNCAAVVADQPFLESTPAEWDRVLSVNLRGAMNCLHTFLPGMVRQGSGRAILLASDSARIGQARLSYYAAAKGGVMALAKSIAQEVGRSGVTLNVVSPGATNTEMRIEREAGLLAQMGPEKYEKRQKAVLKMYPMGRVGEPDDIASSILFLASHEASWVTGQILSVNGGFCMV